jgi:hypothetical protein
MIKTHLKEIIIHEIFKMRIHEIRQNEIKLHEIL